MGRKMKEFQIQVLSPEFKFYTFFYKSCALRQLNAVTFNLKTAKAKENS